MKLENINPQHPNLEVHVMSKTNCYDLNYTTIDKEKENNDATASLAMALMRLENKQVDYVIINRQIFNREMFEFKTSKNFNKKKALELFMYQYNILFYQEILKDELA